MLALTSLGIELVWIGSGIGAAICAITANEAREALRKGEIKKSSFYQQHHLRS